MIIQAILVFLAILFCKSDQYLLPNMMMERPIFTGFLVGLVLGDVTTGILIGAQLELVFLGVVFVGNATSAEPTTGTGIAVAFSVLYGLSMDAAIALGITLSYVCLAFQAVEPAIAEVYQTITDRFIEQDKQRSFEITAVLLTLLEVSISPFIAFLAVAFGGDLVQSLMDNMPAFVMTGISAAGAMLPAVGIAVLASMLWDTKMSIYFLFGFFVMKYMGLEIIFLAMIAIFIAATELFHAMDGRTPGTKAVAAEAATSDESNEMEEFFNE
ncbi:PTS sugar transporter subunit IIC [uncultured Enorma sp.]|jgi:PTS system mannose-specific IIC component|uniref:PTS mannose/fructose/sorbose/N-acetylgalactosamine transporter subunit IIC n=1 Tax=uncultured Enorma sp. TaxID=1714346 RepID=UPI0025E2CE68|nr:PTS sugar transporter subunit IIC [uncultured Enorma sp.]